VPQTFSDLGVPESLMAALALRGIERPFEIQAITIPDALAGRDLCGRAPTGSGKTIAFGVPLLARIDRAEKRRPTALILAPTRELAAQISRELDPLARACARRVFAVYGGVGYEPQRRQLNRGVDVLVACPGRLEDLLAQRALTLDGVQTVVIDEADRMSDMGFLPAVRRLLDLTPRNRQTLLFSATLDGAVGVLTRQYQRDPVCHETAPEIGDVPAARHVFWKVEAPNRVAVAGDTVRAIGPTIVFCRTRRGADRLARQLAKDGVRTEAIHGGRSQNQRDRALAAFTRGDVDAMIATDVAARGIHVDGVACVLHFDTPEDETAYTHRSGRTARAGAAGLVVSLVSHADRRAVEQMTRRLGVDSKTTTPDIASLSRVPHRDDPELSSSAHAAAKSPRRRPRVRRGRDRRAAAPPVVAR
jgi:superfamily II DNA/RNA helicase